MSLSELGNLGEFLASIGVLVSLVFVGFQMKQNAKATRASVRQSGFDSSLSWHNAQIDPKTVAVAQFKLDSDIEIDDFEAHQIDRLYRMNFRAFENRHYQYLHGLIDKETWIRSRVIIWGTFNGRVPARCAIARRVWNGSRRSFHRDFVAEVESLIRISPEKADQLWGSANREK